MLQKNRARQFTDVYSKPNTCSRGTMLQWFLFYYDPLKAHYETCEEQRSTSPRFSVLNWKQWDRRFIYRSIIYHQERNEKIQFLLSSRLLFYSTKATVLRKVFLQECCFCGTEILLTKQTKLLIMKQTVYCTAQPKKVHTLYVYMCI